MVRGTRLDRYELIEKLGEGGMASVFLAHDSQLGRDVALKLLRTDDPGLRQRFVTEARITARCRHVNIVEIYEMGEYEGLQFIALEHLRGRSLAKLLEEHGRVPYAQAVGILVPLLRALRCIHEAGIVHRDLKPENIFMTEEGMPKLLDFGIAKEVAAAHRWDAPGAAGSAARAHVRHTQDGMLVGTPHYMSPEQCGSGAQVDHLTDIWACGVLLHRLICGTHPLSSIEGNPLLYTAQPELPMPAMALAAPPDVPRELAAVTDRCLCKQKDQRWQSADELCAALTPFLTGYPAAAAPIAPPQGRATAPRIYGDRLVPSDAPRYPILCLTSDASGADGSIQLGRQAAAIRRELESSRARDRFEVVTQLVAEPMDLLRALRRLKPAIVYFVSGGPEATGYRFGQALVGDRFGGLFFRGRDGRPQFLSPSSMERTFGAAGHSVRLVLLSGCYVELQAEALLTHVDCVVGTRGTVAPEATLAYAVGFMGALGDHEPLEAAHQQACAAIHLEGLEGGEPPQMKVRAGVDASRLVLATMP